MIGELLYNKQGKPLSAVSNYQPSNEVALLTSRIQKDYQIGFNILHRPYREFGEDLSPIQIAERDQKLFNSYIPPESNDPHEQLKLPALTSNTP